MESTFSSLKKSLKKATLKTVNLVTPRKDPSRKDGSNGNQNLKNGSSYVENQPIPRMVSSQVGARTAESSGRQQASEAITTLEKKDLLAALPIYFSEDSTVVLMGEDGQVCLSENYSGHHGVAELRQIIETVNVEDRDQAIRDGLIFQGRRYEVFRFHPPLVYGRTAGVAPKESVGIVVIKHELTKKHACFNKEDGSGSFDHCYMVITYTLPDTSTYVLNHALAFCSKFL